MNTAESDRNAAQAVLSQAQADLTAAQAAYDQARAAYEAAVADGDSSDAAWQEFVEAKSEYERINGAYTAAKNSYESNWALYESSYNSYNAAAEEMRQAAGALGDLGGTEGIYSSAEFFKDMNASFAYQLVTGYKLDGVTPASGVYKRVDAVKNATHPGDTDDATAQNYVLGALEQIRLINEIRVGVGLPELVVTDSLMAKEQGNINYSDTVEKHATGCGNEILGWETYPPISNWYNKQKAFFDAAYRAVEGGEPPVGAAAYNWYQENYEAASEAVAATGGTVEAYLTIINPDYTCAGAAYNNNSRFGSAWGVVFESRSKLPAGDYRGTVDEYQQRYIGWLATKHTGFDAAEIAAAEAQYATSYVRTQGYERMYIDAYRAAIDNKLIADELEPDLGPARQRYDAALEAVGGDFTEARAVVEEAEANVQNALAAVNLADQDYNTREDEYCAAVDAYNKAVAVRDDLLANPPIVTGPVDPDPGVDPEPLITGWQNENGSWRWYDAQGVKATGVTEIDGDWYLFDDNGAMCTGWTKVDGKWYLSASATSGKLIHDAWGKGTNGKWYYLGSDCVMYADGMYEVEGDWYWFDGSGNMLTGWILRDGKWYCSRSATSGKLMHDEWGKGTNGKWYYLGSDCVMYASGKYDIDGDTYIFDASGNMLTGWISYGGEWYHSASSTSGKLQKSAWYKSGSYWYWLEADGTMACNETLLIDGTSYHFDPSGHWVK